MKVLNSIVITTPQILKKRVIKNAFLFIYLFCSIINSSTAQTDKTVIKAESSTNQTIANESSSETDECGNKLIDKITLLTAFSFDFDNTITPNYYAKLNLDSKLQGKRFAYNAGISRTKFSFEDTTNHKYIIDSVLISPLRFTAGDKAIRKYNKYTSTRSIKSYSFYFQPAIKLDSKTSCEGVYLHGHIELLVNRASISTKITTLTSDTFEIFDTQRALNNFAYYESNSLQKDITTAGGYFGIGCAAKYNIFTEKNQFFIQGTIGYASQGITWTTRQISGIDLHLVPQKGVNTNSELNSEQNFVTTHDWFYLFRAEYRHTHNDESQLLVGFESRGFIPSPAPLHSAYIGLNVSVEGLLKLVTPK